MLKLSLIEFHWRTESHCAGRTIGSVPHFTHFSYTSDRKNVAAKTKCDAQTAILWTWRSRPSRRQLGTLSSAANQNLRSDSRLVSLSRRFTAVAAATLASHPPLSCSRVIIITRHLQSPSLTQEQLLVELRQPATLALELRRLPTSVSAGGSPRN